MFKAAVLGEYEKICGFSVLGFDIIPVRTKEEAKEALIQMLEKNYCIIYVTTDFFTEVNTTEIAVLPIPDSSSALGNNRLNKFAEKAIGSKI